MVLDQLGFIFLFRGKDMDHLNPFYLLKMVRITVQIYVKDHLMNNLKFLELTNDDFNFQNLLKEFIYPKCLQKNPELRSNKSDRDCFRFLCLISLITERFHLFLDFSKNKPYKNIFQFFFLQKQNEKKEFNYQVQLFFLFNFIFPFFPSQFLIYNRKQNNSSTKFYIKQKRTISMRTFDNRQLFFSSQQFLCLLQIQQPFSCLSFPICQELAAILEAPLRKK